MEQAEKIRFEFHGRGGETRIKSILKKLEKVISGEFKKSGLISVALISAAEMKRLNKHYRKKNKSTDILTFVLSEDNCLGEILLNSADIKKRAKESGKNFGETALYLIIHGICHIFGYTHRNKYDAAGMERRERRILKKIYTL